MISAKRARACYESLEVKARAYWARGGGGRCVVFPVEYSTATALARYTDAIIDNHGRYFAHVMFEHPLVYDWIREALEP
jgi:hypothetical protein